MPTHIRGGLAPPHGPVSLVMPGWRMSHSWSPCSAIPTERRAESFADDLNKRRSIVSGRVTLLPRSTEIQLLVAQIRPILRPITKPSPAASCDARGSFRVFHTRVFFRPDFSSLAPPTLVQSLAAATWVCRVTTPWVCFVTTKIRRRNNHSPARVSPRRPVPHISPNKSRVRRTPVHVRELGVCGVGVGVSAPRVFGGVARYLRTDGRWER